MGYMWKGRFKEGAGRETMDFTSSIAIDKRLAPYDIRGSKAHVSMLVKCGIIEKSEGEEISVALEQIEEEISHITAIISKKEIPVYRIEDNEVTEIKVVPDLNLKKCKYLKKKKIPLDKFLKNSKTF